MKKSFRLIVYTSTMYDVKAENETEAIQMLKGQLQKENPREIFTIQVVEEAKIEEVKGE